MAKKHNEVVEKINKGDDAEVKKHAKRLKFNTARSGSDKIKEWLVWVQEMHRKSDKFNASSIRKYVVRVLRQSSVSEENMQINKKMKKVEKEQCGHGLIAAR